MKKSSYILLIAAALAGCVRDEGDVPSPTAEKGRGVTLELSVAAALPGDSHTEPMTRVDASTKLCRLRNKYRYFIYKKTADGWYVERSGYDRLRKSDTDGKTLYPTTEDKFDALTLELRPGSYHIVVTLNPVNVKWNDQLTEGTPVRKDDGSLETPWLFQYWYDEEVSTPHYQSIRLNNEIFLGTADFTVTKTGDLHSDPAGKPVTVPLSRITSWYRVLLKDNQSLKEENKFDITTPHFWNLALVSLDTSGFPQGVDAWGDAWYPSPAQTDMRMYVSSGGRGRKGTNDTLFMLAMPEATYFFPMVITDKKRTEGHKYKITDIVITAQSGHMSYYYLDPGTERTIRPNSYAGIVLEASDTVQQVDPEADKPMIIMHEGIGKDGLPDNPATLFDEYYEWNN